MEFTEKWEGGKIDHPDDPGGKTNMGVTQFLLSAYDKLQGNEPRDVFDLTREEAREIYENEFWKVVRGDKLPERVALAVFDTAINSSPKTAVKMLQDIVGTYPDGKIGPQTLNAVYQLDPHELFEKYNDARENLYNKIVEKKPSQVAFIDGWMNRLNDLRDMGTAGGFETLEDFWNYIEEWRAAILKNPATDDPMGRISDEDYDAVAA